MKILHLNSYYIRSGLYTNLYDLQVKDGQEIKVFVPVLTHYQKPDYELGKYADIVPDFTPLDRYFFPVKNRKMYADARRLYKDFECDLVHSHTLFTNGYLAYKMKREYGREYIVAVRDTDVNDFFKKQIWLRRLGNKILKEAKYVVFLSESYRKCVIHDFVKAPLRDEIKRKSVVIPNGIDAFWINHARGSCKKRSPDMENRIRLICVGTLYKRKNMGMVVRASKELILRGFDVSLLIVGPVVDHDIYDEVTKEKFVTYLPKQPEKELLKLYARNDIFVLPSVTETFGLVYAEALTQGVPVIYTRGQGFDEQFPDGEVGYAVNCFDPIEIADKILEIKKNYEDISKNCINGYKKFDWTDISRKYNKLYQMATGIR